MKASDSRLCLDCVGIVSPMHLKITTATKIHEELFGMRVQTIFRQRIKVMVELFIVAEWVTSCPSAPSLMLAYLIFTYWKKQWLWKENKKKTLAVSFVSHNELVPHSFFKAERRGTCRVVPPSMTFHCTADTGGSRRGSGGQRVSTLWTRALIRVSHGGPWMWVKFLWLGAKEVTPSPDPVFWLDPVTPAQVLLHFKLCQSGNHHHFLFNVQFKTCAKSLKKNLQPSYEGDIYFTGFVPSNFLFIQSNFTALIQYILKKTYHTHKNAVQTPNIFPWRCSTNHFVLLLNTGLSLH